MSELTEAQIAKLDAALTVLAQDIAEGVSPSYDFEVEVAGDVWNESEEGDRYHSEQVYSTNQGPSAGTILWDNLSRVLDDDAPEEPEWADEWCDDLQEQVSVILAQRFPDREAAWATWDDNCLFVVVSEK
jgi:hypothetical protein